LESGDEAVCLSGFGAAVEVVGPEVLVQGAILQHVIDGCQYLGGDRADGFLRFTSCPQTMELCL